MLLWFVVCLLPLRRLSLRFIDGILLSILIGILFSICFTTLRLLWFRDVIDLLLASFLWRHGFLDGGNDGLGDAIILLLELFLWCAAILC